MKTLGKGGRAKNGQFRRKSRFNACAQCGVGTLSNLCESCHGKIVSLLGEQAAGELKRTKNTKVNHGSPIGNKRQMGMFDND